jgi:hypothetical protein
MEQFELGSKSQLASFRRIEMNHAERVGIIDDK